jgi:hypothetical protein
LSPLGYPYTLDDLPVEKASSATAKYNALAEQIKTAENAWVRLMFTEAYHQ